MTTFGIIKAKKLLFAVVLIIAVTATSLISASVARAANKRLPVYSTDSADKIAISFDASWGADKTRKIIEIMSSYGATGTFFLT